MPQLVFPWVQTKTPVAAKMANRPLVAYIAHSFGSMKTVLKWPIASLQYNSSTGDLKVFFAVDVGWIGSGNGSTMRITGMGAPWDTQNNGYFVVTNTTGSVGVGNKIMLEGTIATGLAPTGTYVPSVAGIASAIDMSNGYSANGWLAIARAVTGNGFAFPQSYQFGIGGGLLTTGGVAGDLGFSGWVSALLAYLTLTNKPRPQYAVVDLGINDITLSVSLAAMQAAALSGFRILTQNGVKPIVIPCLGGNSITLAQSQKCRAYNLWLQEVAQTGLILTFDPTRRILDPASANGNALARAMGTGDVHLQPNAALDVARVFATTFASLFPAQITVPISTGDQFDANNNPTGSVPVFSGTLSGILPSTASQINLSGTAQNIGNFYVSSAATGGTVTAQISASTEVFADGTPVPGNELVITFPAGTWSGTTTVGIGTAASQFMVAGTQYNAGDSLQAEVYVSVDSANLSATPTVPSITLFHQDANSVNLFSTTLANLVMASTNAGLAAGTYALTTPVFPTPGNSRLLACFVQLNVSGTTTGAIKFRIRGAGIRKIDLVNGEPS